MKLIIENRFFLEVKRQNEAKVPAQKTKKNEKGPQGAPHYRRWMEGQYEIKLLRGPVA